MYVCIYVAVCKFKATKLQKIYMLKENLTSTYVNIYIYIYKYI